MTSESIEIRLTAVNSCAEMIKPFIKIYDQVENRQKAELYSLIRNVLECLVKTAIVDTGKKMDKNAITLFNKFLQILMFDSK